MEMTLCDKQHKRELCDKSLKLADKMIAKNKQIGGEPNV